MYKYLTKDYSSRLFYLKNEYLRRILIAVQKDLSISLRIRLMAHLKMDSKIFINSSIVKIHNHCTFTGRSHSIDRTTRVSRLMFRKFASNGLLPGIKKISW